MKKMGRALRLYGWSFVEAICLVLMVLGVRFIVVYRVHGTAHIKVVEIKHELWNERCDELEHSLDSMMRAGEALLATKQRGNHA